MFSVIIPAYNAESFIQSSIDSVLSQTRDDYEIVVVDDGSNDHTAEIIKSIDDFRIRYIYQENKGVSAARNTGIRNAKGEYICFLDADDLWKPHHLEVIYEMIEAFPDCDVYITGHELRLHNGKSINKSCGVDGPTQINNAYKHIWNFGYFFHTNSIACRTSVFDEVGLFEIGVKNCEDDDMWYRLFAYYSVAVSNVVTTVYIRENSRATASKMFVEDWIFLHRVEGIMASSKVTHERKQYLRRLLEQRKLSAVRYKILIGDKKNARKNMRKIDKSLVKKGKYIVTLIALIIPSAVSNFLVLKRDKHYYGF